MKMSNNHLLILKHLRNNGRKSFSNISRDTGIPVTTVFDNYKKFKDNGIITKHILLLDFKKLGFHFRSFIFIKTKDKKDVLRYLNDHHNVNSLYRISTYDYLVDAIFPTIKEFYFFLDDITQFNIIRLETHDVVEQIKNEEFFCE